MLICTSKQKKCMKKCTIYMTPINTIGPVLLFTNTNSCFFWIIDWMNNIPINLIDINKNFNGKKVEKSMKSSSNRNWILSAKKSHENVHVQCTAFFWISPFHFTELLFLFMCSFMHFILFLRPFKFNYFKSFATAHKHHCIAKLEKLNSSYRFWNEHVD